MGQNNLKQIIHGRVNIQIGKHGINDGVINQIIEQFKRNKFLKIRFLDLHFFDSIDEAAEVVASRTNSRVADTRGKTCVLERLKTE